MYMKSKKTCLAALFCFLSLLIPGIGSQNPIDFEQRLPSAYIMETLPDNPKIRSLALHLIREWQSYRGTENPNFDFEKLIFAITYAAEKHRGQTRKDAEATPYIIHPLQVCKNLWESGKVRNSNILIAAILHDTLEDTSATEEEIQQFF